MKNIRKSSKHCRSLLKGGARALALTSVLLAVASCSHGKTDTDNSSSKVEVTTSCTTTMTTSTGTTSTTSSTTTSTTTTATTTTTIVTTTEMIVWENIAPIETQTYYVEPVETEYIATPLSNSNAPITDYERTLLRNVVAREYGSDWVSIPEKAKVVSVVMNRVNNPQYPNTIEGVLTQPDQFSGYYACNYEWSNVTDSVREAVDYYFEHQEEFDNCLGFWGDGQVNHFY